MRYFDLLIVGAGSGNTIPGPEFSGRSIAFVEKGRFGGTCLNVGCIPTKMFVHTAEIASAPAHASRYGVSETLDFVDWPAVRDRIFGRLDPISDGGAEYRQSHPDNKNMTVFRGVGQFIGPKTMRVTVDDEDEEITAEHVVIAAGARPVIPPIPGLVEALPHTSDTIMRLEHLPSSLAILGSGFIAAEMAHIFSSFGVKVSILARSNALLRKEDRDISQRYTELASQNLDVHLGFHTTEVHRTPLGVEITGTTTDGTETLVADELLVAVSRTPNSDLLDVTAAGIDTHDDGRIVVDEYQRVIGGGEVLDGVWALGDICSPYQLKHVANHEARTVRHNLLHPDDLQTSDHRFVPHAVFGNPQVASVGLTEEEAREAGYDIVVGKQAYADIAYGWAMEDTTGFAKIIAEKESTRILGAHIIGPQASTLIQVLIQAMSTDQTARDIARNQYWIHPAMPELVENALLQVV
ncbi:mycothione reductase [Actinobaculum sp. 313]|uniref:mycothione reductase n=1 Tax=Actinobaculum sp. 313 TaxID=2495645 RepID=UPI000D5298E7|nr:mycothione reductase [Actinobaculum sp. 313]AWE43107.1 mycothione reductase [Actinobaculum sp. 313]